MERQAGARAGKASYVLPRGLAPTTASRSHAKALCKGPFRVGSGGGTGRPCVAAHLEREALGRASSVLC